MLFITNNTSDEIDGSNCEKTTTTTTNNNNNNNKQQEPRSPPCFHIPEDNFNDDDGIEMISNNVEFTGYALASDIQKVVDLKCAHCRKSSTDSDIVTG